MLYADEKSLEQLEEELEEMQNRLGVLRDDLAGANIEDEIDGLKLDIEELEIEIERTQDQINLIC